MSRSVAQIKCKRPEEVFPEICRTCLCEATDRNLYTTEYNKISLQTMLQAFTGLQTSPGDKLPQYVCDRCADDIQSAYSFHTRSHETDTILRRLQKQMHTIRIYTCSAKQSTGMKSTNTHDLKASDKKLSENPEDVSKQRALSAARGAKMHYKCRFCSKTFQMKPNFIKHLQKHTTKKKWKSYTKRKAYKCHTCGMVYISQTELVRHLMTHTAVKDRCSPFTITKESVGDGDSSFHNLNQDYTQNIVEELQVGFEESIKEEKLDDVHSTSKIINEPLCNNQSELDILKEHTIKFGINKIEETPEEDHSTYKANDEFAEDDEWWLFHEPTEYILSEKILEQSVTQSDITDDHLMCNNATEAPLFDQSNQDSIKKKCEKSTEDSNDTYTTSSPIRQFKQDSKQQSSIELLDGLSVTIKEEKDDASSSDVDSSFHQYEQDYARHFVKEPQIGFDLSVKEEISDDVHLKFINEPLSNNQSNSSINIKEENPDEEEWSFDSFTKSNSADKIWEARKGSLACHKYIIRKALSNNKAQLNKSAYRREDNTQMPSASFTCESGQREVEFKNYQDIASHYISIHCEGVPLKCPVCGKGFPTKVYFRRHLRLHLACVQSLNNKGLFKCPKCPKEFSKLWCPEILIRRDDIWKKYNCNAASVRSVQQEPSVGSVDSDRFDLSHSDDEPSLNEPRQCSSKMIAPRVGIDFTDEEEISDDDDDSIMNSVIHLRYICAVPNCKEIFIDRCSLMKHYRNKHYMGSAPFKCLVCAMEIAENLQVLGHLRSHMAAIYKCPRCPKVCRYVQNLKTHINTHRGELPLKCLNCPKQFRTRYALDVHSKTHSSTNEYKCEPSKKEFHLRSHEDSIIKPATHPIYSCAVPKCKENFMHRSDLLKHYRNQHNMGSAPFKCLVCGIEIAVNLQVFEHLRSHIIAEYKCPYCPKVWRYLQNLKRHIQTHTGERPLKCLNCPKRFITRCALDVHSKTHSSTNEYECKLCKKEFNSKIGLRFHLRSHKDSITKPANHPQYSCAVPKCKENFMYRRGLMKHYRNQHDMGSAPFKCLVCAIEVAENLQVFRHLRSHIVAEYKCPHCPRVCRYVQNLKRHIQTHTGERPLKCLNCPKQFRTAYALDVHSKTHSSINEYECKLCKKEFHSKNGLRLHLKSHQEIKELQCNTCGKQFPVKSKLQRHLDRACCNRKSAHLELAVNASKETNCFKDRRDEALKVFYNQPVSSQTISKESRLRFSDSTSQEELEDDNLTSKIAINPFNDDEQVFDHPKQDSEQKSFEEQPTCLDTTIDIIKNEPFSDNEPSLDLLCFEEISYDDNSAFEIVIEPENDVHFSSDPQEESNDNYVTLVVTNEPSNDGDSFCYKIKQESVETIYKESHVGVDIIVKKENSASMCGIETEPLSGDEAALDQPKQESYTKVKQEFLPVDLDLTVMTETSDDGNSTINRPKKSKKVTNFPCAVPQCGEKFTQRLDILDHYITHHNMSSPPLNCPVCTIFIEKKIQVIKHLNSHIRVTHKCPHCPKKCISSTNLRTHIQTHATDGPFKCPKCPEIFRSRILTITHYTQKHNMESTPLECPECAKVFTDNDEMLQHLKSHVVVEFLCPYCPKICPTQTNLLLHKKTHPKPTFTCPECDQSFKTRGDLKSHTVTHVNYKGYSCDFCQKEFYSRDGVVGHMRNRVCFRKRAEKKKLKSDGT